VKNIHRTYKFELLPNEEQKPLLDKHFGCVRYIYNHFLNASQNILKEGLKIYGEELAITKVEEKSDIVSNAHPVKPEAHPIASGVGG
jgi:putative transposase